MTEEHNTKQYKIGDEITFNSDPEDEEDETIHTHNGKVEMVSKHQVSIRLTNNKQVINYFKDEINIIETINHSPKNHNDCFESIDRLRNTFIQYDEKSTYCMDKNNIISTLNDFLSIMSECDIDSKFVQIHSTIAPFCDIRHCEIFKRNYRNKKEDFMKQNVQALAIQ
eukprot:182686_1